MGMFDTFTVDDCDGQVKIYDRTMSSYSLGDYLPRDFFEEEDYGVRLRHGGWVVVKNNVFFKYQKDKPKLAKCYNKWGKVWDESSPCYD